MTPPTVRLRDVIGKVVPWWLSRRELAGKVVGYAFLWAEVAVLDRMLEHLLQGLRAAWPGAGTAEALPWIGRSRGILRGVSDTEDQYAVRLQGYLDRWIRCGSRDALALALHEYLPGRPRVRVVNRAGHWFTVNADGTTEEAVATFDWDSISHPQRAGFWSELWVIIYNAYPLRPDTLGDLTGDDGFALGTLTPRAQVDAAKGLLSTWKSAHSNVRAAIFTTDDTLFDPAVPLSCPDGQWGAWGTVGSGHRTLSHRNYTTCRYWEPL